MVSPRSILLRYKKLCQPDKMLRGFSMTDGVYTAFLLDHLRGYVKRGSRRLRVHLG
jgi:hypothetical protein